MDQESQVTRLQMFESRNEATTQLVEKVRNYQPFDGYRGDDVARDKTKHSAPERNLYRFNIPSSFAVALNVSD